MVMAVLTVSAQQTEIEVSDEYVMDSETGQFIRIVNTKKDNAVSYVGTSVQNEPQTVIVREETANTQSTVETVASVIKTGIVVGALVHMIKHPHHHHRHHHHSYYYPVPRRYNYCPPVRHHHHHRRR